MTRFPATLAAAGACLLAALGYGQANPLPSWNDGAAKARLVGAPGCAAIGLILGSGPALKRRKGVIP